MLDLKTGKFVIDAEKGWEVHPFMTREEFQRSGLFNSEYQIIDKDFKLSDPFFSFRPILMNGCNMYMTIFVGGSHDCVKRIVLTSKEAYELHEGAYGENWREAAHDIKRMHDEFLMREVGLDKGNIDSEKNENWFTVEWGDFHSSMSLRYEPILDITISYDNITKEERIELERLAEEDEDL